MKFPMQAQLLAGVWAANGTLAYGYDLLWLAALFWAAAVSCFAGFIVLAAAERYQ